MTIPLTFTSDDKVYIGFRIYKAGRVQPGNVLVVAFFEGDPELWEVEPTMIDNLKAYYTLAWGGDRVVYEVFNRLEP